MLLFQHFNNEIRDYWNIPVAVACAKGKVSLFLEQKHLIEIGFQW